jgi:two-component system, chemotaxis family, chemotaxis protein CheY
VQPPAPGQPKKVLVVDDDLELCALIARFLTKNGYAVLTAPDAIHARAMLEREQVRLVITDLMMPHQDGIAFAQTVHELPNHKDTPVILITAYPSDQITDKSMRRGVALTLAKPINFAKLLDLVGFATS